MLFNNLCSRFAGTNMGLFFLRGSNCPRRNPLSPILVPEGSGNVMQRESWMSEEEIYLATNLVFPKY